jgi:hypothetical protein
MDFGPAARAGSDERAGRGASGCRSGGGGAARALVGGESGAAGRDAIRPLLPGGGSDAVTADYLTSWES